MKKLTTTTIAVALAAGSAFAGSDHYGSDGVNQPTAPVGPTTSADDDNILTGSIRSLFTAGKSNSTATEQTQPKSGRGIWGR